jgi:peptidoglycan/LPS O-acetylase OafA/YrhL
LKRIAELDGLRAIAILAVLGCHYRGFVVLLGGMPEFGWVGVDIFFALSGYLITRILLGMRNKPTPYRTFYARRAIRILPPYLGAQALIVLVAIALHRRDVFTSLYVMRQGLFLQAYAPHTQVGFLAEIGSHLRWYITHTGAALAVHPLPQVTGGMIPDISSPGYSYWSLSIEEWFYLLWAPVVLRLPRRAILVVGIAVCLVSAWLRAYATTLDLSYFNLFLRFDSLIYGGFLAMLVEHWDRHGLPCWRPAAFKGILLGAVAALAAVVAALWPVQHREIRISGLFEAVGLPLIAIAATAVIGLLLRESGGSAWYARLLRSRAFQFIGTISYTMYLTHLLVMVLVHKLFFHWSPSVAFGQALVEALVATGLTIVLARFSWHYLEKPLLRWKDRRVPTSVAPPEPVLN